GQGTVLGKLERLLSEGGFMTMGEYVSSLKLTDCVDAVS
ncbi:MAG: hypothetical protein ACI9UQ_002232, partial [Candidatus Krumholzibacteriia bacterium]